MSVYLLAVAFAVCELAGTAAIVRAYDIAQFTLSNTSEFAWFYMGMFLLELPLVGLIARRATPQTMRTALLTFYGLVSYIPKLLRNPTAPAYHDEFAHWRATYEILSTGKLFQPNPLIHIIAQYPGLHAATAALVHATGLSIWQAAILLLILSPRYAGSRHCCVGPGPGFQQPNGLNHSNSVCPEFVVPVFRHTVCVRVDGHYPRRVDPRFLR